jgi:uncharacterized protein (TIGR02466 family)
MPAKAWFPTFVYEAPLKAKGADELGRALLQDCHALRESDTEGKLWCRDNYPAGYTSYGTQRRVHRLNPSFAKLERLIWPHVKRFARRIDMDLRDASLAMTDCWVNIMSRESVHPLHVHPGATFSGTYYVSTPPGCAGIHFEDPRLEKAMLAPPKLASPRRENRQKITYEAKAGSVILFESWLGHGVASNPTVDERVSISFNYTWV